MAGNSKVTDAPALDVLDTLVLEKWHLLNAVHTAERSRSADASWSDQLLQRSMGDDACGVNTLHFIDVLPASAPIVVVYMS